MSAVHIKSSKEIPKCGLKLKFSHVYPENRSQEFKPGWRIIIGIIPLIIRYLAYYFKLKWQGREPIMDFIKTQRAKQIYGVPLGGIGVGSIGRGFRGEFCRFQLKPGMYEWNTVEANQFIVTIRDTKNNTVFQSLLSSFRKTSLSSWESKLDPNLCRYTGLYPRGWSEFDLSKYGIKLVCRQISPIIPKNYKDSCLPCAVFVWDIVNTSSKELHVTIAFTFKNGTGSPDDKKDLCSSRTFNTSTSTGVLLDHKINNQPCTYAISSQISDSNKYSQCLYFDPNSSGLEPWSQLHEQGSFGPNKEETKTVVGEIGIGLAVQTIVPPSANKVIKMGLAWHLPTVKFRDYSQICRKIYTRVFGDSFSAVEMSDYAFSNYERWEEEISKWQDNVLENPDLPDWYKSALFNETYYVSDGGSLWLDLNEDERKKLPDSDIRKTVGRFAYLEGHEYRMYNTYDVHFYASFALKLNWPMLQHAIQYDMKDAIFLENTTKRTMLYSGEVVERKVPKTVPHDLGDPDEGGPFLINGYPVHDVSQWKDLGSKFILQVWRDANLTDDNHIDLKYLEDMYGACNAVMLRLKEWDKDNDGLIENTNFPDQTYDMWTMEGPSAYCGSLWLAALYAMSKMAKILNKSSDEDFYQEILDKGKVSFEEKLWNDNYYKFDTSELNENVIMSDQLCGHWYLRMCGDHYEVFPKDHVQKSLRTIYRNNVQMFCDGSMGAVNGFVNGDIDRRSVQSMEVWIGVVYGLGSLMIMEGMVKEAFVTVEGLYRSLTETFGLAFDTPEAIMEHKYYRSIGYMRPLCIWSIQLAIEKMRKIDKSE